MCVCVFLLRGVPADTPMTTTPMTALNVFCSPFRLSDSQILRSTKIVRSIASTPNRGGGGSGSIAGGWERSPLLADEIGSSASGGGGKGAGDGVYYSIDDANNNGGSDRKGGNRSSIVAHVQAEALCSNPLKPCGACMEWLKKIAEVNPDFKVITFTDSRCGGVYIEDVAQIP